MSDKKRHKVHSNVITGFKLHSPREANRKGGRAVEVI